MKRRASYKPKLLPTFASGRYMALKLALLLTLFSRTVFQCRLVAVSRHQLRNDRVD